MAVEVRKPQKKQNELGQLLPIAGAVIGGMSAGPGGAMAGASQGAALGQLGAGALSMAEGQQQQSGGVSAAERRLTPQAMPLPQEQDPMQAIQEAQVALANLPPEQQKQFGPALSIGQRAFKKQEMA